MESIKSPTRQIRCQLEVLLHCRKCFTSSCPYPKCAEFKEVLQHLNICRDGRACQAVHCASSSQILRHWELCKNEACVLCMPIRQTPHIPVGSPGSYQHPTIKSASHNSWAHPAQGDGQTWEEPAARYNSSEASGLFEGSSRSNNLSDEMKLSIRDAVQSSMTMMLPQLETMVRRVLRSEIATIMLGQEAGGVERVSQQELGRGSQQKLERGSQQELGRGSVQAQVPELTRAVPMHSANHTSPPSTPSTRLTETTVQQDVPSTAAVSGNGSKKARKAMTMTPPSQQGLVMIPPSHQFMMPLSPANKSTLVKSSPASPSPQGVLHSPQSQVMTPPSQQLELLSPGVASIASPASPVKYTNLKSPAPFHQSANQQYTTSSPSSGAADQQYHSSATTPTSLSSPVIQQYHTNTTGNHFQQESQLTQLESQQFHNLASEQSTMERSSAILNSSPQFHSSVPSPASSFISSISSQVHTSFF